MRERGQATVEYAGLVLLLALVLLGGAAAVRARPTTTAGGDRGWLALAALHRPAFVAERGDGEHPVDFRRCRRPACARGGRPVLFVHGLRRGGAIYLEYWEYLPDSRTAHTGLEPLDGAHADDWEGVIVKLRPDGAVVGARASAHLGWAGRHPWWELRRGDWAPYPATVYRASGSHAGSFRPAGIDLAGDGWDGGAAEPPALLVAADEARRAGARFGSGSIPPWQKQVWTDPEAVVTGRPGDGAVYARYAGWWASLCRICAR